MPTTPGTPSTPLDTKQAAEKFAGLIVESGVDEPPETDAAAAPVEAAEKPAPPEPTPQSSDTEPTADEQDGDSQTFDIDGEPVTLGELKKSRLRQDDYTRKTQALAEERKSLEAKIRESITREVGETQSQYVQGLATLRQALNDLQGEPDWADLRGKLSDADFLKQRADWEQSKSQRERLRQHEDEERQKLQAAQQKQYQEYVRGEWDKTVAAIPEWADVDKAKAERAKLMATAKSYGFSEEHANNALVDHRLIQLVRDAMRYKELQREPSAQVKAKVAPIKTAKPGTPAKPRPNEQQTKLIERVAKTGRQRDAMAAIEAMLE